MGNLRYVCLSDLHLGARYSLLTAKNPLDTSPVLAQFSIALRAMLGAFAAESPGAPLPQLVLNGDILDLGLSPISHCAMGFQRFIEALYPPPIVEGSPEVTPVLSYEALFVPGNHDHKLWTWSDENRYGKQLRNAPRLLQELDSVTPMFVSGDRTAPGYVESELLGKLLQVYTKSVSPRVITAYPNLAVSVPARTIVFHHGHYLESEYRMMSSLRRFLGLGGEAAETVAELEKENGAWIDFLWSSLGDAGLAGKDTRNLYTRLQGGAETEQLIHAVTRRIVTYARPQLPMGGERQVQSLARHAVRALLDVIVQRTAEMERNSYATVLGEDSIASLRWYLETPVAAQFATERQMLPNDLVFVFGHTHKPFEDAIVADGYANPVRVFNTGGWVLDEPVMASLEGAAMVLVDDALNVVSLRLFNQAPNGVPDAVHVGGAYPQVGNPLLDSVQRMLPNIDWKPFTVEVGKGLLERQRAAFDRFSLPAADRGSATPASTTRRQAS
jgi:hypothetical protein